MAFDIKAIFGDKETMTADELSKAVAGLKLVDLSDGEYVAKEKFDKAEADVKKHRDAATAATKALDDIKAANASDDSPAKQLEKLQADIESERKAREATEAKLLRKEREVVVASKVASAKLQRTLLMDAEALMDDDTDFDTALAKAIEADPDYAPKPEGSETQPVRVKTGKVVDGKPVEVDADVAAFAGALGVDAE